MRNTACKSSRPRPPSPPSDQVYTIRHAKNGSVFGYHSPASRKSFAFAFERKEHAAAIRKYAYMQPYLRESFVSGQYIVPKNLDDAGIIVRPMDVKQLVIQRFVLEDARRYFQLYGMGTVCISELRHTKRTVVLGASAAEGALYDGDRDDDEDACSFYGGGGIDWRAISLDMLYYDSGNQ